jgi:hypothetical protein
MTPIRDKEEHVDDQEGRDHLESLETIPLDLKNLA